MRKWVQSRRRCNVSELVKGACTPVVESLEGRRLLSVVTVGNTSSAVNGDTSSIANLIAHPGNDGISFAEALTAANNTAGPNGIIFPASFNLQSIDVANLTITNYVNIEGPLGGTVNFSGPSAFDGDTFGGGGRILTVNSGVTAFISNVTFQGGDATDPYQTTTGDGRGGAIESAGSLTVKDCVFYNNGSGEWAETDGGGNGGAIDNSGVLNLDSSSFYFNFAQGGNGGGVDNAGTATITNSTFYQNQMSGRGGALANEPGSTMTVDNCTILQNGNQPFIVAPVPGLDNVANFGVMNMNNCIVSDKMSGNDVYSSGLINGTHNLIKDGNAPATLLNTIVADPKLQAPVFDNTSPNYQGGDIPAPVNGGAVFTFAPLANSPCIDAGDNNSDITITDARGVPRINNGTIDIGAVEIGAFTVQVTTLSDEDNGTIDPANGAGTSLREALSISAPENETITFAPGLAGIITLNSGLALAPTSAYVNAITQPYITIVGNGNITLDGQNKYTDLTLSSASISGVNFINGYYNGGYDNGAGAIYGNYLTLTDCSFNDNWSFYAGGALDTSNSTIVDCTFSGNSAVYGGGAVVDQGLDLIQGCTFTGNFANDGGAVMDLFAPYSYETYPAPVIADCTFSNNTATDQGGAIICYNLDYAEPVVLGLDNCTIVNNSAANNGGGVLNTGTLYMTNCTVYGNAVTHASGSGIGAGVATVIPHGNQPGTVSLNNNLIAGNIGGADLFYNSSNPNLFTGSHNLIGDGSGGLPNTITGNPMLGPLQNNGGPTQTMAISVGSPAINAGSSASDVDANGIAFTTDQRGTGFLRIAGGGVDAGAYQLQSSIPWLAVGSQATWNASNHTLVVTGTATIIADPGTDEPQITFTGSNDLLKIQTAGNVSVHLGGLNLSNGATVQVISPAKPDVVIVASTAGLSIDTGSQLDLGNSDMIVQSGNASQIFGYLKAGYSNGHWSALGAIDSTNAHGDTTHLTALGMLANTAATYTTFDTIPVTTSDVLIKFTYYGDATLAGSVGTADYTRIDAAWLNNKNPAYPVLSGWSNGDLNYDGVINGSDYTLIDNAFNMQGASITGPAAQVATEVAVPADVSTSTSSLGSFFSDKKIASSLIAQVEGMRA